MKRKYVLGRKRVKRNIVLLGTLSIDIRLPKAKKIGTRSLEETLNERRSVRDYKAGPLSLEEVSQLLWAASGINLYRRTTPSAGATYPLEVYLAAGQVAGLAVALYHYSPPEHALEMTCDEDVRRRLFRAALGQEMVSQAPIDIVIAAEENSCPLWSAGDPLCSYGNGSHRPECLAPGTRLAAGHSNDRRF